MSTSTPRLQLKRNDGTDPFQRQDFVDNWNKLDAAPGHHVCTSTSRPTWGAAQAGRLIWETDTRTQWSWSGTAWLPPLTATSGWMLGVSPVQTLAAGAAATYTLGTITTTRPGTLLVDLSGVLASLDTAQQNASVTPYIGGAAASGGSSGVSFQQWTGSNNNASYNVYENISAKGYKAVAPGSFTIQARVSVGAISTLGVHVYRLAANIMLINEQSR